MTSTADVVAGTGRASTERIAVQAYLRITALVFVAYLIAGKLGQATIHIRSSNLGPVWPAYGVALAAVILCGSRAWLGILIAAFVVAASSPVTIVAAAGQATGATLAAITGGALLRRVNFDPRLWHLRDVVALMLLGAWASAIVSASIGVMVLYATGVQPYSGISSGWLIYLLGDATGVLLITPLVIAVAIRPTETARPSLSEFGLLLALLTTACFIIFGDFPLIPVRLHVLAFAVLPFVMWAAIRFSVLGVTIATLLVATIATVETALGSGPFSQDTTFINAVLLDVFFAVLSVSGLTLAVAIAERERVERERERLVFEQAAMEAVRESEDKLRLILDSTAEAIYGVDTDGRCTFCNPAGLRALGYERVDDLIGRHMHSLIHHTRADGTPYPVEECPILHVLHRSGGGVHCDDEVLWTADGASFHAELWSYPQLKGDQVVGAVIAFIDITQRRRAEHQATVLRDELVHLARVTTVDALAGSLAHEINQPLTAVMANTEAALRLIAKPTPPLEELREALEDIRSDNQRAGEVVQRLRTLLKKGSTSREPIDINATIADVVRLIRVDAAGRGITIDVELAADLEPIVADRIQVQQVVLNLLMNAFDAVQEQEPGNRRVGVTTARNGNAAVVEVRDRGAGLSDTELVRIFDPFYTTKPAGLGLGLSICRAIVVTHGGTLHAVRHSEVGMTLSAAFPFAVAAEPPGERR